MRRAFILSAVVMFASVASAQTSDCSRRTFAVSAVSSKGKAVRDLTVDAFQPANNPAAPQVRGLRGIENGHAVILMDVSNSMRGKPKMEAAAATVIEAVRAVPAGWKVEIVLFGDTLKQYADVTMKRDEVVQILTDLLNKSGVRGRTAMFDAVQESLILFSQSHGAKAILIVTDGGDNTSRVSLSELERSLLQGGIRLFAATMPDPLGYRRLGEESEGPRYLQDLAEISGGAIRTWRPDWQIAAVEIRDFVELMGAAYVADVQVSEHLMKPTRWKLELTSEAKKKWKGVTLLYPQKILPCGAVAALK